MSKEAMKLVERLSNEADLCRNEGANDIADLLGDAAKALAKQPTQQEPDSGDSLTIAYMAGVQRGKDLAQQEPDWKAEYLKSVESGCITLDELREANAELDATNRQVEILSDALAESRREIDALVALARADEREKWRERAAILIRGEREACAKVADEWSKRQDDVGGYISRNIRARSNT
jgi:hypothetical protein